jgi:hypothetical protein
LSSGAAIASERAVVALIRGFPQTCPQSPRRSPPAGGSTVDEVPAAAVTLPDRLTVLTCIGCGGMGREERCEGTCSEHKLVLVSAADYDALLSAAQAARARAARLAPVVGELAEAKPGDPRDALLTLRDSARRALRDDRHEEDGTDWASPSTVTGWWCARCGNVDMPQPCVGVCVWRPAQWVNLTLYERQLGLAEPALRGARSLHRFLARVAALTPRDGQWQRNWEALQAQARTALADYDPDAPAPAPPGGVSPQDPGPAVRVHLWPR